MAGESDLPLPSILPPPRVLPEVMVKAADGGRFEACPGHSPRDACDGATDDTADGSPVA